ncbi:hypothetical protein P2Q66_05405, partial [Arthrobacter sp. Cr_A7]|nr:hypothetical protein [Arthrobacter sp. Cr_A7]
MTGSAGAGAGSDDDGGAADGSGSAGAVMGGGAAVVVGFSEGVAGGALAEGGWVAGAVAASRFSTDALTMQPLRKSAADAVTEREKITRRGERMGVPFEIVMWCATG